MNRKKSWVLLLLFALSLTIVHGFFTQHHHDTHASIHQHDSDISLLIAPHDNCDECPCFHLNFTVNTSPTRLPEIATLKPKFELPHTTPFSYTNTLYKPPTA